MHQPSANDVLFPDPTQAPFCLSPGASAARVAAEMVACFEVVAGLAQPTRRVFTAASALIGLDRRSAHARAGQRIAAVIDREAAAGPRNAYHNHQHTCEVMLCALLLARQQQLPPMDQARVLVAALIHDFRHDGTTNFRVAFRLEHEAVTAARPFLVRAGIGAPEIERIAALVLATDITTGAPFARRCLLHGQRAAGSPAAAPPPPPTPLHVHAGASDDLGPLSLLAREADLALQAVLVSEADLLPSVALTPAYGNRCQGRLARENHHIIPSASAKLAFLNTYVPRLLVARFFTPNLERQRRLVATESGATSMDPDTARTGYSGYPVACTGT